MLIRLSLVLSLVLGCSVTPLPAEKCTPSNQALILAACERARVLECDVAPDTCPLPSFCDEALALACPAER